MGRQNICWKRHLNSHTDSSRRICHLGVDVHSFSKIMQQTVSSIAKALWANINHQRCLLDLSGDLLIKWGHVFLLFNIAPSGFTSMSYVYVLVDQSQDKLQRLNRLIQVLSKFTNTTNCFQIPPIPTKESKRSKIMKRFQK